MTPLPISASLLARVRATQRPDGGFAATVRLGATDLPDANGFVAGLILRALARYDPYQTTAVRARAVAFLARCESPTRAGVYNFYPANDYPNWLKKPLPDDADDTAILALERLKAGQLSRATVLKTTCLALDAFRLPCVETPAPPWLRAGMFLTWLQPSVGGNPVDCCVNANVVALYAYAGLTHWRGYAEACAGIEAGVCWAGDSLARARSLTPYYPDPTELRYAVQHAVDQGATRLEPTLARLRHLSWARPSLLPEPDRPVCGSAYGGATWQAPVLQHLRHASNQLRPCLIHKTPCC
jgi:hypothetical protein